MLGEGLTLSVYMGHYYGCGGRRSTTPQRGVGHGLRDGYAGCRNVLLPEIDSTSIRQKKPSWDAPSSLCPTQPSPDHITHFLSNHFRSPLLYGSEGPSIIIIVENVAMVVLYNRCGYLAFRRLCESWCDREFTDFTSAGQSWYSCRKTVWVGLGRGLLEWFPGIC